MHLICFKRLAAIILLLLPLAGLAQFSETVDSDRPGMSIGARAVGSRTLQVQMGTDVIQIREFWTDDQSIGIQYDGVIRYGIKEHFELGISTNYYNRTATRSEGQLFGSASVSALTLGLRARSNILKGDSIRPALGMQVDVFFPDPETKRYASYIRPRLTLVLQQPIGRYMVATVNVGGEWLPTPLGFFTTNLTASMTDHVNIFIEYFGQFYTRYAPQGMGEFSSSVPYYGRGNAGMAVLINNDLQLDLQAGYGRDEDTRIQDWYVGIGISWRVRFPKQAITEGS